MKPTHNAQTARVLLSSFLKNAPSHRQYGMTGYVWMDRRRRRMKAAAVGTGQEAEDDASQRGYGRRIFIIRLQI